MGFRMFDLALPNLKEDVISIIAEDNHVACQVVETATFTGPMELPSGYLEPTKRSYKIPVASFFRINADGLIAEQRTYWDTSDWERQIGIDPKLFAPRLEPSKTSIII
jgi:predicted ester cyclase